MRTSVGDPLLSVAVSRGDVEIAGALLNAGANWRAVGAGGVPHLHRAAQLGNLELVEALLAAGAPGSVAGTATYAASGRNPEVLRRLHEAVRLLLEAGADPGRSGDPRSGWTPLISASMSGDSLLVRLLVEAGADPDARDREGKSAADHARGAGNEHVVPLLERSSRPER